jgi:hypothetical protein
MAESEEKEPDQKLEESKVIRDLGWRRRDHGNRGFWTKLKEANATHMTAWINELDPHDKEQSAEELLGDYKSHINQALEEGVGRVKPRSNKRKAKRFVWSNVVFEAVCAEKKAYKDWKLAEGQTKEDCKEIHRTAKKNRKRRSKQHEFEIQAVQMRKIEELRVSDPKEYWNQLKQLSRSEKKSKKATLPSKMKDDNDEWVLDKEGVAEVWARSFEKLGMEDKVKEFDAEFAEQVSQSVKAKVAQHEDRKQEVQKNQDMQLPSMLDQDIRLVEVQAAIKNLKRGKATGIDKYMNEIFMYGGEKVVEATWRLCAEVFRTEKYPRDWARGLIFPIFKGGPKELTYNPLKYRGITLLSVLGKIYTAVLTARVTKWAEEKRVLVEEQAGFRANRSTVDQLFILTECIKNRRPDRTYCCFIDVQKAYDRVWRDGLWEKLHTYGIQGRMWRVLRNIYEAVESSVLVGDTQSRFLRIDVGGRQSCRK